MESVWTQDHHSVCLELKVGRLNSVGTLYSSQKKESFAASESKLVYLFFEVLSSLSCRDRLCASPTGAGMIRDCSSPISVVPSVDNVSVVPSMKHAV